MSYSYWLYVDVREALCLLQQNNLILDIGTYEGMGRVTGRSHHIGRATRKRCESIFSQKQAMILCVSAWITPASLGTKRCNPSFHYMKILELNRFKPSSRHVKLAYAHGSETLDDKPPQEFYEGCPLVSGFEIAEPGCLIKMRRCVMPHCDQWLGDWGSRPRKQRSFFWVLKGEVVFKSDGYKHLEMSSGDWVVLDHRREHMVLSNSKWLGAAWQLRQVRKRIT